MKLKRSFFTRPAPEVAKELLGKYIVRLYRGRKISGRIVETEAYCGPPDRGSHAFGGKVTPRNKIMYHRGGHVYIYFIYGMYWLFNITTGLHDHPEAVLIRAVELPKRAASGPGKFCQAFKLDKSFYGEDLTRSKKIWLEEGKAKAEARGRRPKEIIAQGPRIGIEYAGPYWAKKPWRFWINNNPYVSR